MKDKDNLPNKDVNRVMRTIADSYKEEWFDKGLVQGIEQGIEEGEEKKAIETICLNLTWNLSLSLL